MAARLRMVPDYMLVSMYDEAKAVVEGNAEMVLTLLHQRGRVTPHETAVIECGTYVLDAIRVEAADRKLELQHA